MSIFKKPQPTPEPHDPDNCQAGEDCVPCQIAERQKRVEQLALKAPRPSGQIRREALDLLRGTPGPQAGLAGIVLLTCCLFLGCVSNAVAVAHAKKCRAASVGHANDDTLPQEARDIGAVNAESWGLQLKYLDGDSGE